jgi:hypothetical protein
VLRRVIERVIEGKAKPFSALSRDTENNHNRQIMCLPNRLYISLIRLNKDYLGNNDYIRLFGLVDCR